MIRVLIAAASGVIRAGLESLLRSSPNIEVVVSAPDVVLAGQRKRQRVGAGAWRDSAVKDCVKDSDHRHLVSAHVLPSRLEGSLAAPLSRGSFSPAGGGAGGLQKRFSAAGRTRMVEQPNFGNAERGASVSRRLWQ